jgi:hypothetical protein
MSNWSVFPNGISNLVLRGTPLVSTNPGKVFFVYNGPSLQQGQLSGNNGNSGTYVKPYATIAYAVSQCVADRGDIIIVRSGHAETISNATTLALNVAGVAIIGLGTGSNRPTLTFSTANTANIPVTANNVTIQNFLFVANFLNIASAFTVTGTANAKDFTIDNCEFRDNSSVLNFVTTVTGNATANTLDGFTYSGNKVFGLSTTANTTAVTIGAVTSRASYLDNYVVYPALNNTAALATFGAAAQTNLTIARNKVFRPSTSTTGGSLFSGSATTFTGYVYDNYSWHLTAASGLLAPTGTGLGFQNNYCMISGLADKSGVINPAAV